MLSIFTSVAHNKIEPLLVAVSANTMPPQFPHHRTFVSQTVALLLWDGSIVPKRFIVIIVFHIVSLKRLRLLQVSVPEAYKGAHMLSPKRCDAINIVQHTTATTMVEPVCALHMAATC